MLTMTGLTSKPTATAAELAAADALTRKSGKHAQDAADSFERSDTDGFVSQWASGLNGDKAERNAELLRDGRHAQFRVLFDTVLDRVVSTTVCTFANTFAGFGTVSKWRVDDEECLQRVGRKFMPTGSNSRVQKQAGLEERLHWFPAVAILEGGGGRGMSGASSVCVVVVRKEEALGEWASVDAKVTQMLKQAA